MLPCQPLRIRLQLVLAQEREVAVEGGLLASAVESNVVLGCSQQDAKVGELGLRAGGLAGQVVEKRVHDAAAHVAVVRGEDI